MEISLSSQQSSFCTRIPDNNARYHCSIDRAEPIEILLSILIEKRLKVLRYKPRISPKTGKPMKLLSEEEEDVHLDEGMQAEETFIQLTTMFGKMKRLFYQN